jgi:hypothetical protein
VQLCVIDFISVEELNRSMDQLMKNEGAHASEGNLCLLDKSHVFSSATVFGILIMLRSFNPFPTSVSFCNEDS